MDDLANTHGPMIDSIKVEFSAALERIAESLDIPPSKHRDAVAHYDAVANWLNGEGSGLRVYRPSIYPQGSFRIGTVVRPVRDGKESDYDIDLVCELRAARDGLEAGELKNLVGDRLKENGTYRGMLDDEGRRCWTLKYAESDGVGFHLDALAGLSEGATRAQALTGYGARPEFVESAIAITERLPGGSYRWDEGGSNPARFAAWFDTVNEDAALRLSQIQKTAIFDANRRIYSAVQNVPDALVRTPLQRAIQLLKRHRDVRFAGHELEGEKPISMIITTIAARGFRNETETVDALQGILERVSDFASTGVIEKRGGEWWIPNPVNPSENFADRWSDPGSRRAEAFFEWIAWVRQDLTEAGDHATLEDRGRALADIFAVSPSRLGIESLSGVASLSVVDRVPGLASTSHRQMPPWSVREQGKAKVVASVRQTRGASKARWNLSRRSVRKGSWLRFEVKTNVRPPYDVQWQVVNTGEEAASAGGDQMRGGFDRGEGLYGTVRWESTAYRGTHTIEAFVIKEGVCVARSGATTVRVR